MPADVIREEPMSTRSSIWLGESEGRTLHIYWELAERETESGKIVGVPIYIAADAGDADKEIVIRLPKGIAVLLLSVLSDKYADELTRII